MKKGLCLLVILAIAMTMLLVACSSENDGEKYLSYTLNEDGNSYTVSIFNEEMLTKYSSEEEFFAENKKILSLKKIIIPAQYEGKPVTAIGYGAFAYIALENIIIPDSVTSIGDYAFSGCAGLTSITIPDNLRSIGEGAFNDCTGLTNITIPDNITSISDYAFAGCAGLTSITIPDHVTSIGNCAFADCTGLTSITIPDSVTSIGAGVFRDCTSLAAISVGESNTTYFSHDGILYLKADNSIMAVPRNIAGDVMIVDGVTTIERNTFKGCTGLTSITIPDSVTFIGEGALQECTGLTKVTLPFIGAIKDDNESATFGYIFGVYDNADVSQSLKTVVITGESTIGDYAFRDCAGLTSITIPDSVKSIGDHAFSGCTGLTNITIPDSVTSIGDHAFSGCTGLTNITIPDSVTSIGVGAFSNCNNLKRVDITDIEAWCQIEFEDNPLEHISQNGLYLNGEVLSGDLVIPEGVTSIGSSAFKGCAMLTSITIPDSVTNIGYGAFDGCVMLVHNIHNGVKYLGNDNNPYLVLIAPVTKTLRSLEIHENTQIIDSYALSACMSLTSITIPKGVVSIGEGAIAHCAGLQSITVNEENTIYHSIENCLIETETGTLIAGCNNSNIPDGVTSIGYCAFSDCTGLTSITIPDSVTSIGRFAFARCTKLSSITISNSVTSIGGYAFDDIALTDIYFIGTEEEWAAIRIEEYGNDVLNNVTIHYNYVPEE